MYYAALYNNSGFFKAVMIDFIIPAFNEAANINSIIEEIREYFKETIIVIDDGSTDNTYELIAEDDKIIKIRNANNMGKGYSVKKALKLANSEYFCIVDGDAKGIAGHIYNNLDKIKKYDCIIFTPPVTGGGFGLVRNLASHIIEKKTGEHITWGISGVRIIKKDAFELIKDKTDDRFAFEVSTLVELINNGFKIININADFNHRVTEKNLYGFIHRGRQFLDLLRYKLE